MLTEKQRDLLLFIDGAIKESGLAPTFEEMKVFANLKTKSAVARLIDCLVERGYIRRLRYRARAIEVVRLPGTAAAQIRDDVARAYLRLILIMAPSFQGGHSKTGGEVADLLGIPFPLTTENLAKAAVARGFDPAELWPWREKLLADRARAAQAGTAA